MPWDEEVCGSLDVSKKNRRWVSEEQNLRFGDELRVTNNLKALEASSHLWLWTSHSSSDTCCRKERKKQEEIKASRKPDYKREPGITPLAMAVYWGWQIQWSWGLWSGVDENGRFPWSHDRHSIPGLISSKTSALIRVVSAQRLKEGSVPTPSSKASPDRLCLWAQS